MAIADNIGYDATGKNCAKLISKEELIKGNLKTIIEHLSHDLFDEKVSKDYDIHDDKKELATRKEILDAGILKELRNFITAVDNGTV